MYVYDVYDVYVYVCLKIHLVVYTSSSISMSLMYSISSRNSL